MREIYLFSFKPCIFLAAAFTCLVLFPFREVAAQRLEPEPIVAWDKTLSNIGFIEDMVVLPDDQILLATNLNTNPTNYSAFKLDANGNYKWHKVFGGDHNDNISSILVMPNGDIILAGTSDSGISGNKTAPHIGRTDEWGYDDYWVVKLDSNGNKLWDKTYGTNDSEYLTNAIVTPTGEIVLTGNSVAYRATWIVKLDGEGNEIWETTFSKQSSLAYSMEVTPEGDYIIAGGSKTFSGNNFISKFWVVKVDINGKLLWNKIITPAVDDRVFEVGVTSTGEIVLAGFRWAASQETPARILIIKLDANGNKLWEDVIPYDTQLNYAGLEVNDVDDIFVGYTDSKAQKTTVVSYSIGGEKRWTKTIVGEMRCLTETSDHSLILGGKRGASLSYWDSLWVAKIINAPLEIENFSPVAAPTGAIITIKGKSFLGLSVSDSVNAVMFNGRVAKFTIVDDQTINTTVPYGLTSVTGTGKIKVITGNEIVKSVDTFTVIAATPLTIESFSPTSGSIGTSVTISGTGFLRVGTVKFKDVSTAFTIVNDSTISTVIPAVAGTMGKFKVIYNNKVVESQDRFLLFGATPLIESVNAESKNLIKVYPNPTTGKVSVVMHEAQDSTGELTIKTMYGETVYNAILKTDEEQIIDLHQFNKRDIFIFQFIVNGSVTTQKVIVE